MLRIYGSARSRALRTLWMAGELGLTYDHNDLLPRSPATRSPEYLALNPNARVPTIEDDGFVLSELMAINLYLAKKHGSPLYPADPQAEALCWQWSFWEVDRLDRQIVNYANHSFALAGGGAEAGDRRGGMGRDGAGAGRAGGRAAALRVAGGVGVQHCGFECGGGAVPRIEHGSGALAARHGMAEGMLAASRGEARAGDAGIEEAGPSWQGS